MTARGARWTVDSTTKGIVVTARDRCVAQLLAWSFWLDEDTRDTIRLVVSELVTNAIVHGRSPRRPPTIEIGIFAHQGEVYIEVLDPNDALPVLRAADGERERGRGLVLVDCMSVQWGVERLPHGGKRVWTLMKLPPRPSPRERHRARLRAQLHATAPLKHIGSRPLAMAT